MKKEIRMGGSLCSYRSAQIALCGVTLLLVPLSNAQEDEAEEIFELSPFTVEGSEDTGYRASSTMAGSRIRTDLKDVGSAISVITEEFLRDTGATDNASLLQYTTSTEVGGIGGNFGGDERLGLLNPNANTRVRGLTAADNTRDFFLTDIPWDGYNVNRVDMQRGPNAILSGLGSPAGIINNTVDSAVFANEGEIQLRFGSYGSTRVHFNLNRVILEDELSVRVAGLMQDEQFRQEEAWSQDERLFVAAKYEPAFLKSETASTIFTANFERGDIDSNRPRTRPPVDRLSGFWEPFNEMPAQITGHPLAFATDQSYTEDGTPVPVYSQGELVGFETEQFAEGAPVRTVPEFRAINFNHPWYGENYTDGPVLYFANADEGDGDPTRFMVPNIMSSDNNVVQVVDGEIVTDLGGTGHIFYRSIYSPAGLSQAARHLGLPLATYGGYENRLIYDRSIFDYENHLIDGDNKREFQEFEIGNATVSQTLWQNRVGIEGAVNRERYDFGQSSPFGWSPEITIDVNTHLGDFSPNPNVGRPVIFNRTQGSSSANSRERESYRVTAFGELRQGDIFDEDSFLGRLLGKQRLTGLVSGDDITFYEESFKNWLPDDRFRNYQGTPGLAQNEAEVMAAVYLGPSVIGTDGPEGLNLQPIPRLNPKAIDEIRYWDSNWANPDTLNPDFLLQETWYNPWNEQLEAEQDNPNNYIGWRNTPVDILVDTQGDRLNLITNARAKKEEVTSEAFVWQGFFWDGAVVAMYGSRSDDVLQYSVTAPRIPVDPRNIFDPTGATPFPETNGDYRNFTPEDARAQEEAALGSVNEYAGTNESKSLVVHLDQFLPELPLNTKLSLMWNESSNFQPAETRVDHLNRPLAPPTGETEDYGFLLSTFNDKLTFKVNFYESTVSGASFDPGSLWYVGTAETSLFAAGMRDLAFIEGVPGWSDEWRGYANDPYQIVFDEEGNPTGEGDAPYVNYLRNQGIPVSEWENQTPEEAQEWQERAVADLREKFAPQQFWDAWGATKSDERWQNSWWDPWNESTGAQPAGFTSTSDLRSEGTEYELNYNPTENWNIALNAAQTETFRENIAGSLQEWVDARNEIFQGDAGDIRLWWSGDRNNTLKTRWNNEFYSGYQLALQQEGQATAEMREWRVNLITNYMFRDGMFNGLSVGGAYRWEDEVGIGYPQSEGFTEEGNPIVVYDIDDPIMGPSESHLDLWASYRVSLTDDIDWRIQLNIRDVLAESELIPISVNPNGEIAQYRLEGDPTWFLTNTFSF